MIISINRSKSEMVNFIVLVYKMIERQTMCRIDSNKERKRRDGAFKTISSHLPLKISSSCSLTIEYPGFYWFSLLCKLLKFYRVLVMFLVSLKIFNESDSIEVFSSTYKTWTISFAWRTQTLFTTCMFIFAYSFLRNTILF